MKRRFLLLAASLLLFKLAAAQTSEVRPASERSPAAAAVNAQAQTDVTKEAEALRQQIFQFYKEGKFREALPLAERALAITSRTRPDSDPYVTDALINLAELHLALKKFGEAESLYQRLLVAHEVAQQPNQKRLGEILDRLALISYARGNFSKAEAFYKRALAAKELGFGPDSPQVRDVLYALAEVHRFRYEFNKAEPLYRRALVIEDKTLPPGQDGGRKNLDGLTCLFYENEQQEKLKALIEERRALRNLSSGSKLSAGSVLNGRAISLPKPAYPPAALRAGYGGIVVVKVKIDGSGKVVKAEDLCGAVKSLAEPSIEAAYRARFTPTLLSGQPVEVGGTITYRFAR
jgi:tetratricopeptide (TPR) repeat protein